MAASGAVFQQPAKNKKPWDSGAHGFFKKYVCCLLISKITRRCTRCYQGSSASAKNSLSFLTVSFTNICSYMFCPNNHVFIFHPALICQEISAGFHFTPTPGTYLMTSPATLKRVWPLAARRAFMSDAPRLT
jgi:hypothetical protein